MAANLYDQYKGEVAADVDAYIQNLKDAAESQLLTFGQYLKQNFGNGITEDEIRTAMMYSYIASKYSEKLFDDFSEAVTGTEIDDYVADNMASFYSTTYTAYPLYVNDNEDFRAAIEACKTADEVKTFLVDYFLEEDFEEQYKLNITDKGIDVKDVTKETTKADVRTTLLAMNTIGDAKAVFTSTDTDDYKKAAYTIANALNTDLKKEIAKVTETTKTWTNPEASSTSDVLKYVFGKGRVEGDRKLVSTTTTKDGKDTTTYTWVLIGKDVMKLDTEKTKDAHYIVLSDDKEGTENAMTAAEKAEAFLDALSKDTTSEKFAELVEKYSAGSKSDLVERISYESMKTSYGNLADWLYDKDRKENDITKLEVKGDSTDKDKVTGYIVALFVNENEETWKLKARDALATEAVQTWLDEHAAEYGVTVDYEFATTAETTATEATTKAPEAGTEATTEATTEAATEVGTEAATEVATETSAE